MDNKYKQGSEPNQQTHQSVQQMYNFGMHQWHKVYFNLDQVQLRIDLKKSHKSF